MRVYPVVSVTNNSSVLSADDVKDIVIALQHQVSYHFKPYWDSGANLKFTGNKPLPETWELAFLDNSDQAGALGYHDFDPTAFPVGKVFAKTDAEYNLSSSVTASHELLEMLADPYINLCAQTSNTEFYGYEVGDPVEADNYGYKINIARAGQPHKDITVSDFILPHYFVPGSPGKYDYVGHLGDPLTVLDGGYVSIFTSGEGWSQYQRKSGVMQKVVLDVTNPRFRDRSKYA